MPYRTHAYVFTPLLYADGNDRADLEHQLQEHSRDYTYTLHALRRRGAWATTLPPGAFSGDLSGDVDPSDEYARAYVAARGPLGRHSRRPFDYRHDPVPGPHGLFHHVEAIRALREHVPRPALLNAMYRFLLRAVDHPELVVPPRPQAPFVPHALRAQHFGLKGGRSHCRGPAWTPAEDAVLRRWFGQRTAGPDAGAHASLTPAQHERVAAELHGRRTGPSIQQRLCALNRILLAEFAVDGLVPRARLAEYMSRALGERPRVPPTGGRRPAAPVSPERRAALIAQLGPAAPRWTDAEDAVVLRWFGIGPGYAPASPTDAQLEHAVAAIAALGGRRTVAAARQRASALRRRDARATVTA